MFVEKGPNFNIQFGYSSSTPPLIDTYFKRVDAGLLCRYQLREVVYNQNNHPAEEKLSSEFWSAPEAQAFSKLCGGWVLSATEKVAGLK